MSLKILTSLVLDSIKMKISPELVKPKEVSLLVTENCFFRCQTCTYWRKKKEDVPKENLFKIIDQCKDFGIKLIALTGGEPFVRKDIIEIADYIRRKGMKVYVVTNGWISDDNAYKHFDSISISIDGINAETHDRIRNMPRAFEHAIVALTKLTENNIGRMINFVVQKDNYHQIVGIYDLAQKYNCKVNYYFYNIHGLGQPEDTSLRDFDLNILRKNLNELLKKYNSETIGYLPYFRFVLEKLKIGNRNEVCIAPHCRFLITPFGDVFPCSAISKPIGNVFTESLENIWKKNKNLRKSIRESKNDLCKYCLACEINSTFQRHLPSLFNMFLVRIKNKLGLIKEVV